MSPVSALSMVMGNAARSDEAYRTPELEVISPPAKLTVAFALRWPEAMSSVLPGSISRGRLVKLSVKTPSDLTLRLVNVAAASNPASARYDFPASQARTSSSAFSHGRNANIPFTKPAGFATQLNAQGSSSPCSRSLLA